MSDSELFVLLPFLCLPVSFSVPSCLQIVSLYIFILYGCSFILRCVPFLVLFCILVAVHVLTRMYVV
jgi:hypothetical protein